MCFDFCDGIDHQLPDDSLPTDTPYLPPLSSEILLPIDILQLWVQSILPNQQTAGGDMETFNEDRNCFLWVVSVVVLSVSLVALERLLSVAPL